MSYHVPMELALISSGDIPLSALREGDAVSVEVTHGQEKYSF